MITLKPGQRWLLNTNCHKFIVEIETLDDDDVVTGSGKIVQIVFRATACEIQVGINTPFTVWSDDASCRDALARTAVLRFERKAP